MYRLPAPSTTTPEGRYRSACVAGPPSLTIVHSPTWPAKMLIDPGTITPSEPCPMPVRYVVPSVLLPAPSSTTAPFRCPGYFGANATVTVQLPELIPAQSSAPDSVKSRFGAPSVTTSTLATVPAPPRLTVTVCVVGVVVPTAVAANVVRLCARAAGTSAAAVIRRGNIALVNSRRVRFETRQKQNGAFIHVPSCRVLSLISQAGWRNGRRAARRAADLRPGRIERQVSQSLLPICWQHSTVSHLIKLLW